MSNWETFQKSVLRYPELGFVLDTSRMDAPAEWSADLQEQIARAFRDIVATEAGEIMNPDEGRAVGHYWLRKSLARSRGGGEVDKSGQGTGRSLCRKGPERGDQGAE